VCPSGVTCLPTHLFSLLDTNNFISEGGRGMEFLMSVSRESKLFFKHQVDQKYFLVPVILAISLVFVNKQSWNICMPNISNATKKNIWSPLPNLFHKGTGIPKHTIHGIEPQSGQTKDYKIGICCFSAIKSCRIKE
jgi:hypothetical protein